MLDFHSGFGPSESLLETLWFSVYLPTCPLKTTHRPESSERRPIMIVPLLFFCLDPLSFRWVTQRSNHCIRHFSFCCLAYFLLRCSRPRSRRSSSSRALKTSREDGSHRLSPQGGVSHAFFRHFSGYLVCPSDRQWRWIYREGEFFIENV